MKTLGKQTMTEEARKAKNLQIKKTKFETTARRSNMELKTFTFKIVENKLTTFQKEQLKRLFFEAKWLRNEALGSENSLTYQAKSKGAYVQVKSPEGFDPRKLTVIGSQIAQEVIKEIKNNIKGLSAVKKKGRKVGALKFVSEVSSLDLKQHGNTYTFDPINSKLVSIQNINGKLRLRGTKQIPADAELANAKLLNKPDGYYLAVSAYIPKLSFEEQFIKNPNLILDSSIGIDMNVGLPIVLSNGLVFSSVIEETERLKNLQRKLKKMVKGSNNKQKIQNLINREYQKMDNLKDEAVRQIIHYLVSNFETIYFQDENLTAWKKNKKWSRKLHHGILGRLKAELKKLPQAVMLSRWEPTTSWCRNCGNRTKHSLDERSYNCRHCSWSHPSRDMAAAENMVLLGGGTLLKTGVHNTVNIVPPERGKLTLVENWTAGTNNEAIVEHVLSSGLIRLVDGSVGSWKQETL